jgi:hypothetical protein
MISETPFSSLLLDPVWPVLAVPDPNYSFSEISSSSKNSKYLLPLFCNPWAPWTLAFRLSGVLVSLKSLEIMYRFCIRRFLSNRFGFIGSPAFYESTDLDGSISLKRIFLLIDFGSSSIFRARCSTFLSKLILAASIESEPSPE